jgi:membrane-associated phospholipid phosphatase
MTAKSSKIFLTGILLSCIASAYLFLESLVKGKNVFFLVLNTNLGPVADQFFKYSTMLGDGAVWIIIIIIIFVYSRRCLPLIIAAIIISTLITQGIKNFIFPAEPRPTYGLVDMHKIHTVAGVELHKMNSFPSGHTATAFTIFLLACLLIRKWWIIPTGFFYAAMVGYSRIYLAQHFPLDVGGGILTGVVAVILSVQAQKRWSPLSGE